VKESRRAKTADGGEEVEVRRDAKDSRRTGRKPGGAVGPPAH
jgi:hypothetical protein